MALLEDSLDLSISRGWSSDCQLPAADTPAAAATVPLPIMAQTSMPTTSQRLPPTIMTQASLPSPSRTPPPDAEPAQTPARKQKLLRDLRRRSVAKMMPSSLMEIERVVEWRSVAQAGLTLTCFLLLVFLLYAVLYYAPPAA